MARKYVRQFPELYDRAWLEARDRVQPLADIARDLGCSPSAVSQAFKRAGMVPTHNARGQQTVPRHGHVPRKNGKRSPTPTYRSWQSMIARCSYPTVESYPRYGGRGIMVCARWRDFESFLADMGERPEGHTLDRIDGDGNYEPGNCRWADASTQARNRSAAAYAGSRHDPITGQFLPSGRQ